ncbi:MAG: hypothetical protein QNJ75_10655 [Acidimicrobiia bacterium]|nr:hypothetical protein [Acidimicrobiia bacterium]
MKRAIPLIVVLTLLLSACRAEVRISLDVTEAGSGTLAAEVAINNQLKDLIDQLAGDGEAIIAGLDLGLEGERSSSLDGDMTVYRTEVPFTEEDEIAAAAAGNFTFFELQLDEEGAQLEATLGIAGELDLAQFPVGVDNIDPDTFEAEISVLLPGEVQEHNADSVTADGRLVWNIPFDGELYMTATTLYPTGGFPWWLAGLLALSGALALGVWIAAVQREKKSKAVLPPAPKPPPVDHPADREEPAPRRPDVKSPPRQHSPFFEFDDE